LIGKAIGSKLSKHSPAIVRHVSMLISFLDITKNLCRLEKYLKKQMVQIIYNRRPA